VFRATAVRIEKSGRQYRADRDENPPFFFRRSPAATTDMRGNDCHDYFLFGRCSGHETLCPERRFLGQQGLVGGYAEYVAVVRCLRITTAAHHRFALLRKFDEHRASLRLAVTEFDLIAGQNCD